MRKLFFAVALLAMICIVFATDIYPIKRQFGEPQQLDTYLPAAQKEFQTNWGAERAYYLFATESLSVGDVVIWDNTITAVVDTYDASGAGSGTYDTSTIADSIKHNGWYELYSYHSGATADSIDITGTDSANAAQTETLVKASGAGNVWSTKKWRKVNLVVVRNSAANIGINFVPYGHVKKTTDTGTKWVAGVVAEERGADSLIKVVFSGLTAVKVAGATTAVLAGYPLCIGGTSGYATVATGLYSPFGISLESGNTNTTYMAYVNPVGLMQDTMATVWISSNFAGNTTLTGSSTSTKECTADTVLITGATASDHYIIQGLGSTAWTAQPTYTALAGSLIVYFAEGDTAKARASGWQYFRIRQ
jgi:hypothetical protein